MIIVMRKGASKENLAEVKKRIKELGYKPHVIHGETRNVVGAVGDERGKAILQCGGFSRASPHRRVSPVPKGMWSGPRRNRAGTEGLGGPQPA